MELASILILIGLAIFAGLLFWLRDQPPVHVPDQAPDQAPNQPSKGVEPTADALADGASAEALEHGTEHETDGVLVAQGHGKLTYANGAARRWFGSDELTLETITRRVEPPDSLLSLFASAAAQASFQIDGRWVQGSAYRIPGTGIDPARTVVTLREINPAAAATTEDAFDPARALAVMNEIGETVNAGLGVEPVLQALLTIVRKAIPADAGEICLWNEAQGVLVPRGWVGDVAYVLALAEAGGVYHVGEGISGWIAKYRKPVLVRHLNDPAAVRPKLPASRYQSFAAVPLMLPDSNSPDGDRFIGTFELASEQSGGLTQAHLALLQAVIKPVTTAIYNAELYAEQRARIDDIASLSQIAQAPQTDEDAARAYGALGERIATLLNADVAGVLLYDERKQALTAALPFYGLPAQILANYTIPLPDDSTAYDIVFNRDHWLSNDLVDEPLVDELRMTTLVYGAGLTNTILMPMRIGDRRIGLFQIGNKRTILNEIGGFTPGDVQNLRVLAAQAAVVVETVRLYQTERRVDAELSGLQEMTNAIGALRHEGEFYSDIVTRIARIMGASSGGLLLPDESMKQTEHRLNSRLPWYGVPNELAADYAIPLRPGTGIEEIWLHEDTWYSNRVPTDPLLFEAGLAEPLQAMGISRTLFAVLSAGGRRLGMIQVANKVDGSDFTDQDARLLLIFGTQAAAMIENGRLYREAQRRADEAEGVRRVAELASAILTGDDPFEPVLQEIARLTDSPVVFVNTLAAETGALVTDPNRVYGVTLNAPLAQDIYGKALERSVERSVVMSRRAHVTNNARGDTEPPTVQAYAEALGLTRAVIVPLAVGERGLGELVIANRETPLYTDDDRRLLAALAIQLASALERARLHDATGQNLSRRLQELDAISRVSNELNLTLDFDRVLDVIRQEAERATGATGSTIVLLKPDNDIGAPPALKQRIGYGEPPDDLAPLERAAIMRTRGDAVLMDDYAASGMSAAPGEARSAVAAAIVYAEEPIGVLHLYHDAPSHFDTQSATFVSTLAVKAALGHANALRYQENVERSAVLSRRVQQLNQISELGQMLHQNVPADIMLEAMAYAVQQSGGFDTVLMLTADENAMDGTGTMQRVAMAGLPIDQFEASKTQTIPLASVTALLKDDYRISESYFFPIDRVASWYVDGVQVLGTKFDGARSMHPTSRDHWRDGDMLLVPLYGTTGEILGLISLDRPANNRRPDRNTIELLEIFAHQAAATLENARLFDQVRQLADELNQRVEERTAELAEERDQLDALYRITSELARTLDMEHVMQRAVELVATAVRADSGAILLLNPRSGQLYTRAAYGERVQGHGHPAEQLGNWLINNPSPSGSSIVVEDLLATGFWDARRYDRERGDEWRSALAVALETSTDAQGVMVFLSRVPARFSEAQLRLVTAAANQVASAINNADLYSLIRDQAERLGLLLRAEKDEAEKSGAILESIADGVVLADAHGNVVLFNSAAERILNVSRDAILNQPFTRLSRVFGSANVDWLYAIGPWAARPVQAATHGSDSAAHHETVAIERLDVGSRVVNVRLSPVYTGQDLIGTVAVFRDITRDVEVDRMKSEFVSNVSHELRTPMTSIKGYADLMLMGGAGAISDTQRQFLDTIKTNADRLATLVNDLLNISKLDAGREQLHLEDVDAGDLLTGIVNYVNWRVSQAEKPMLVTLDVEPELPAIRADRDRLTQALTNVADNAFNYTYAGGAITVRAGRHANGRQVVISVQDTGIGIPAAFQPRVWGRFERYDDHALVMDVAGTGLGLSIARQIIEMHRGDIWFESEENVGTTFHIALPVAENDLTPRHRDAEDAEENDLTQRHGDSGHAEDAEKDGTWRAF